MVLVSQTRGVEVTRYDGIETGDSSYHSRSILVYVIYSMGIGCYYGCRCRSSHKQSMLQVSSTYKSVLCVEPVTLNVLYWAHVRGQLQLESMSLGVDP